MTFRVCFNKERDVWDIDVVDEQGDVIDECYVHDEDDIFIFCRGYLTGAGFKDVIVQFAFSDRG